MVLFVGLILSFVVCLHLGLTPISTTDILVSLFDPSSKYSPLVVDLRLPRIVCAIFIGIGMGVAGTILQSILKNPLASPFTLGIGSGAGFGAVLTMLLLSPGTPYLCALGAFSFAILSTLFILMVGKIKGSSVETVILAGIAQMYLFSALTSFLQYISTSEQVHEFLLWFFGNLDRPTWREILAISTMVIIPLPYFLYHSMDYDILLQGEEVALSLGIDVSRLRMGSIVLTSLITASCICFTGVIGFIGLVAPHISRMCIGTSHRFLIPCSALVGAMIMLWSDGVGRVIWSPQIIPIGITTSFIGIPFFIYLLFKKTKVHWG